MKTFLAAVAIMTMAATSAYAQMGNITGTEYSGEPINSSVRSSAKNPVTGLTPGGEAYHSRAFVKKQKQARKSTTTRSAPTAPGRY